METMSEGTIVNSLFSILRNLEVDINNYDAFPKKY